MSGPGQIAPHQPPGRAGTAVHRDERLVLAADQDGQLDVPGPALQPEEPVGSPGMEGVGGQPVDGVGRQTDDVAARRAFTARAIASAGGGSPYAAITDRIRRHERQEDEGSLATKLNWPAACAHRRARYEHSRLPARSGRTRTS